MRSSLPQGLDIARRQGAKSLELRAALSLSRLWSRLTSAGSLSFGLLVLEPERVTVGDDVAHRRRREMRPANQHIGIAVALQKGPPGGARQIPIKIRARHPPQLRALHRTVHHVTGDDGVGSV
jgi:hypothetical protein